MCGICGIYEYKDRMPIEQSVLMSMIHVMRHRGPDDEGIHIEENVAIGMCRLSIIDLVSGRQPIYNEDKHITVVFNGEIYNYRDLRDKLNKRGHVLSTASDTEVVIHLYEDLGEECVQELRGMFAFAIWDARKQRLFIARDRLGIKPLYYSHVNQRLLFGSEIKSILQHPAIQSRIDFEGLGDYLSRRHVPSPRTLFNDIYSLPPGHILTCDQEGINIHPYWDLSFAPGVNRQLTEDEAAEHLENLLQESVRMQLMSDVPFGAFLSGGIDSSTVVALMSEFLEEPVKTFSVGYKGIGESLSELSNARVVADQFQTDHHEIIVGPRDFIDLSEKVIWHLDQPIADAVLTAYFRLAQFAAGEVKMVLTGEGGDELFAGYARYAGEQFASLFQRIPRPLKSLVLTTSSYIPGFRAPKQALYALSQKDEVSRFTNWHPLFNGTRMWDLLSDNLKAELNGSWLRNRAIEQCLKRTDATETLHRFLYIDTKLWLPDDLLTRGDKLTMASSLEARVPLLDSKLVEFVASLDPKLKINKLKRKYLMKRVSKKWLPQKIVNQYKKGFPIPVSKWMRNEARTFVRDLLSPATISRRDLFDPDYVARLIDEHESGIADHERLLFGLLSLELWLQLFIDTQPSINYANNGTHTQSGKLNK
jgi:asparagine synthase (glutamine-hydrolysing)